MLLRCLLIADPVVPVPPTHYGGTERIVALLARALSRRGFAVDIMAGPGSMWDGGRLIIHRAPTLAFLSRAFRKLWFQMLSLRALPTADVIINFGRIDYLEAVLRMRIPLVIVFQNPVSQADIDWIRNRKRTGVRIALLSAVQRASLKPQELIRVIHNATDVDYFRPGPGPASPPYLAVLGRLTFNKGIDIAIRVAKRTDVHLKIAGTISDEPGGREFFDNEVAPHLGSNGIEYIGPVNDAQKLEFLGGASALLMPVRWDEPFGIVMAESLACGTPVIAFRRGATPEIVRHAETGFLCDDEEQMVEAVRSIGSLRRGACREDAEARFSADVMAGKYLELIQELMAERR